MGARRVCWDVWGGLPLDEITYRIELQTSDAGRDTDAAFGKFVTGVQNLDETLLKELLNDIYGAMQSYADAIQFVALSREKVAAAIHALRRALKILTAPRSRGSFSAKRERFFSRIDYEKFFADLEKRGATLSGKVFWDGPREQVQAGGGKGGILLLIDLTTSVEEALAYFHDQLLRFQPAVAQGSLGRIVRSRAFDLPALIPGLTSRWTSLEWQGVYVTLIFKEASRLLLERKP